MVPEPVARTSRLTALPAMSAISTSPFRGSTPKAAMPPLPARRVVE
jgi:hypothetical protein